MTVYILYISIVCPLQFPDISRFREEIKKSRGNAIAYLSTIYYQGRIIVSDIFLKKHFKKLECPTKIPEFQLYKNHSS